jgi:tetratricopeptide (TPR) repeat protein
MQRSEPLSFRFSLPEKPISELVELTPAQMERLLLDRLAAERDNPVEAMWQLGTFYKQQGRVDEAMERFQQLLSRVDDLEAKANYILSMGQASERVNDFELAIRFYRQALSLEPTDSFVWYYIHNNLGFSLNQLGRFSEGEVYCRHAIAIDSQRPNGYKNLGIALQGQGRFHDAAEAYVAATRADASDTRSLDLLKRLLQEQQALQFDFAGLMECCEKAVVIAAEERRKLEPLVKRGIRANVAYWRFRGRAFLKLFF